MTKGPYVAAGPRLKHGFREIVQISGMYFSAAATAARLRLIADADSIDRAKWNFRNIVPFKLRAARSTCWIMDTEKKGFCRNDRRPFITVTDVTEKESAFATVLYARHFLIAAPTRRAVDLSSDR